MLIEANNPKDLLYNGLNQLLQNQSIDKLTVREIIKKSNVSKATFYRHYKDKYDLLNSNYESILEKTLFRFKDGLSWEDSQSSIYQEIKDNIKLFQNALQSSDMNSLKNYIFDMSRDLHLDILERNGVDIENWKTVKVIESYIYGNLEIMEIWILDGMKESIDEMIEVFNKGLPCEFAKYFN